MLDVICSILTGSAFVAFLFAAGLALCVSTAARCSTARWPREVALAQRRARKALMQMILQGATGVAQTDVARIAADADGRAAVRPRPLTAFLWGWATALVRWCA